MSNRCPAFAIKDFINSYVFGPHIHPSNLIHFNSKNVIEKTKQPTENSFKWKISTQLSFIEAIGFIEFLTLPK